MVRRYHQIHRCPEVFKPSILCDRLVVAKRRRLVPPLVPLAPLVIVIGIAITAVFAR